MRWCLGLTGGPRDLSLEYEIGAHGKIEGGAGMIMRMVLSHVLIDLEDDIVGHLSGLLARWQAGRV
jgi:hypothetical protein